MIASKLLLSPSESATPAYIALYAPGKFTSPLALLSQEDAQELVNSLRRDLSKLKQIRKEAISTPSTKRTP